MLSLSTNEGCFPVHVPPASSGDDEWRPAEDRLLKFSSKATVVEISSPFVRISNLVHDKQRSTFRPPAKSNCFISLWSYTGIFLTNLDVGLGNQSGRVSMFRRRIETDGSISTKLVPAVCEELDSHMAEYRVFLADLLRASTPLQFSFFVQRWPRQRSVNRRCHLTDLIGHCTCRHFRDCLSAAITFLPLLRHPSGQLTVLKEGSRVS
jgi:hypothetical protein